MNVSGPEDTTISIRCITWGGPNILAGYNSYFQILQTPEHVVILGKLIHNARIIPFDGRPHLADDIRQSHIDEREFENRTSLIVEIGDMRTKLLIVAAGAVRISSATAVRLSAHHAFAAEFDANAPVHLVGKVTKMEWINPHAWVHIKVEKEDGTVEEWMIEGGTPNTLFRRGFSKKSLLPGTVIIVDGYQSKDGSLKANGRDLTLPDGSKLFMGSSGTGAPMDGADPTQKKN